MSGKRRKDIKGEYFRFCRKHQTIVRGSRRFTALGEWLLALVQKGARVTNPFRQFKRGRHLQNSAWLETHPQQGGAA